MTVSHKRLGLLFVLVGPPGAGKNALMSAVLERTEALHQLPTVTTRPMRPNERQGREHHFVDRAQFHRLRDNNALLEWQEVHGELYGVPRATVEEAIANEQDLIADIDVLGATYIRSLYPDNTLLIFIKPPSIEVLRERMRARGELEEEIARRLRRVEMEMLYAPLCDYLIINDEMNRAAQMLQAIILAERSRRTLVNLRAQEGLPRHRHAYISLVIPIYNDEVLYSEAPPHFPSGLLAQGELPHEAALRVLQTQLALVPEAARLTDTSVTDSRFIAPSAITYVQREHFEEVAFVYRYRMAERISPPDGWAWRRYAEVELPQGIAETLPVN